jgi:hypothetical protein
MKNLFKLFATSIVLLSFSAATFAQVSATATVSATIITPIAITKTVDMNFGNIAVGLTGGTVVLDPANARTKTGGVTLPAVAGTVSAASFTVTGLAASTYSITLPATVIIVSGTPTMTVSAFTSTPSGTGLLTSGTQTLTVGGTLTVAASQAAGLYTLANGLSVTVNYN